MDLVAALESLGLAGEVALGGRWVTLEGARCRVYVVMTDRGNGYYGWCGVPGDRTVAAYTDATTAILDGLRRAASIGTEHEHARAR